MMSSQAPRYSKTEVRGYNIIDGLRKIVNSEEIAVSTLRNVKIGKWNLDQVREWLVAVLGDGRRECVQNIINLLVPQEKAEEKHSSKKRKYPENVPSFFGSTTISNRKRRYTQDVQSHQSLQILNNQSDNLTFGQRLVVMKFEGLVGEEIGKLKIDDARLLRDSLNSRLAYEAALDELNGLENLQEWRLRTEKSSSRFPGSPIVLITLTNSANHVPSTILESSDPVRSLDHEASDLNQVHSYL